MEKGIKKEQMIQGLILVGGLVTAIIFFFAIKLIGHDVNLSGDMGLKVGTVFPEFSLPDLSGRMVSSKEYRGKNTMVMFADPGCGFCKQLLPIVRNLLKEEADKISMVIVSSGTDSANRVITKEYKFSCPVLRAEKKWFEQRYKIGVPFLYLIDREGVIRGKKGGMSPDAERLLKRMIKKVS